MLEDSQLSGGFSALSSGSMGAIAGLDTSNPSSLALGSNLIDPFQQERTLFSSSTILTAQAILPPATNLILDFDGATLNPGGKTASGQDYALPIDLPLTEDGQQTPENFEPFKGFPLSSISTVDRAKERDEQILQTLAGVREKFSRFNVRVIWDDRGVNSPFFDNNSTVVIVTDSTPGNGLEKDVAGKSPDPLDDNQIRPDVALAFTKPLLFSNVSDTVSFQRLGNLITTISHEAGHTFGLSHPLSDIPREIMNGTLPNTYSISFLDQQFTSKELERDNGSSYDDEGRLNQNLGGALTSPPNDRVSNQTLPNDTDRVPQFDFIPVEGFRSVSDFRPLTDSTIDFVGDRDAFRFQVSAPGQYTIRETSSAFTPVVRLWDSNGNFISVSNGGKITFDASTGENYFAVVGSTADQAIMTFIETDPVTGIVSTFRGNLPNGQIGNYVLEIGNSKPVAATDQFSVVENSLVTGNILDNDSDPDGNSKKYPLKAVLGNKPIHGTLTVEQDGSFTYTPTPDFFGADSFTYRAYDGLAYSGEVTVSFTIPEAPLFNLIGTPGRDVLIGTDKRDRIIGLQSGDILTGGKGRDQFVFQNINEGGDRITDFTPGKDKIILSGVLQSIGYSGSNPIADNVISFKQASNNLAVLQIDPDTPKNSTFRVVPFILFDNITIADLSNLDNFVF